MPGIVGIIGPGSAEQNIHDLNKMIMSMMHEPFYTSGAYVNDQIGIWIGWVTHPVSFSDCMPVWNEAKDVCLIFSGEDFTDNSEIKMLKSRGHQFNSENASYIVHMYEEQGISFVEKLNGCFNGVLVDLRKQRVVLFNDRYGLARVYYHENDNGFYFGSEAKSLLKVLPKLRQLDMEGLAETVSCGCALQNRTIFSKVSLLPGGSLWTFDRASKIRKEKYFTPDRWEQQPLLSGQEYYENLKNTFTRLLPRYFRGSQKVGMSLTGGFDGRMIMAWANCRAGELPCYTFGSSYHDNTDVKIARQVAKVCGQSHKTIVIGNDFFSEFPCLAEKAVYVSDGTMDVSGSVELFANRIASGIAPIRMTGNYGSEIMRGNVAFKPGVMDETMLVPAFSKLVRNASTTYQNERRCNNVSFIAFKQVPWHHYSRLSVESSLLTMRSPYLDNDLVSLMYQAPPELIPNKAPSFRLIAEGNEKLAKIPTDRGRLYHPIPVVTKCQHLFQEAMFRAEYVYDYGMPQWLAKIDKKVEVLHLERLFLGRHKFYHFRVWYRNKLSEYLKDTLLDRHTLSMPFFRGEIIEQMVSDHLKGYRNYTREISRILTLEIIQRKLIQQ